MYSYVIEQAHSAWFKVLSGHFDLNGFHAIWGLCVCYVLEG